MVVFTGYLGGVFSPSMATGLHDMVFAGGDTWPVWRQQKILPLLGGFLQRVFFTVVPMHRPMSVDGVFHPVSAWVCTAEEPDLRDGVAIELAKLTNGAVILLKR